MWQSHGINDATGFSVCMTAPRKNIPNFDTHGNYESKSWGESLCEMNKSLVDDLQALVEHKIEKMFNALIHAIAQ